MSENGKCWLITGGCGFIGTTLIERILEERLGDRVRVLDNLSVGKKEDLWRIAQGAEGRARSAERMAQSSEDGRHKSEIRSTKSETNSNFKRLNDRNRNPAYEKKDSHFENSKLFRDSDFDIRASDTNVQLVVGDIRDPDTCLDCTKEIDVVVHLAANTGVGPSVEDPRTDMENNLTGTLNMLEAARQNGVERFVFASSGAPVGEVEPPIHEELAPKPVSPYGASKLAGEGYCSAYFGSFGLETVALRFGNVYGPGSSRKNSVVAKFIKHLLAAEHLPIYGDGSQTRDFIYIQDLVRAILLCAERPGLGGELFQIATHREHTVDEIAEGLNRLAEKHLGRRSETVHQQARKGDVKRNYSDISKARRMLGFEPKWELEKGLEETFLWFLAQSAEKNAHS